MRILSSALVSSSEHSNLWTPTPSIYFCSIFEQFFRVQFNEVCIDECAARESHFVGSLVWPHRFRHRILHFKHVHPMRQIAETQKLSAATGVIYGLALGYLSTIISVVSLGITILVAHSLCGMFGVALGALGMLGTLTMGLTIDAFGPISDNAGGIVEMSQLGEWVRERTDVLDAVWSRQHHGGNRERF